MFSLLDHFVRLLLSFLDDSEYLRFNYRISIDDQLAIASINNKVAMMEDWFNAIKHKPFQITTTMNTLIDKQVI